MRGSSLILAACTPACLALAVGDPPSTPKRQLATTCDLPKCQSVKDKASCVQPLLSYGGGALNQLLGCVPSVDSSLVG